MHHFTIERPNNLPPMKGYFRAMISNPIDPMSSADLLIGSILESGDTLEFQGQTWDIQQIDHLEEEFEGWEHCILDITCTLNGGVA